MKQHSYSVAIVLVLLGIVMVAGCTSISATTESDPLGEMPGSNAPTATPADTPNGGANAAPADTPNGGADAASAGSDTPDAVATAAVQPHEAAPHSPPITPISAEGYALEDVLGVSEGLRLEYAVSRGGVAEGTASLVLQPSAGAWANRAVHGAGVSAYTIMGEESTRWYPVRTTANTDVAAVLSAIPWPRYFPHSDEIFQYSEKDVTARIQPGRMNKSAQLSGPGRQSTPGDPAHSDPAVPPPSGWSIGYRIDRDYGRNVYGEAVFNFASHRVQPGEIEAFLPTLIRYADPAGTELRYELTDATVFRAREIAGAVVNRFGQPRFGYAVAPHPMIGLLPTEHVGRTDETGRFSIDYRAAPGDTVRLYFGPVEGEGRSARIIQPLVIEGRIESPDFATLIYTAP